MFWTRLGSSVVLVVLALIFLISGGPVLGAVCLLLSLTAYYELIKACHVEKDGKFTLLEIMGGCGIVLYGCSDDAFQKLSLGNRGNCPDVSGSDVRLCVPFSQIPCRPGDDCFFLCILPGGAVSVHLSDPGTELGKISGVAHFYQLLDL